MAASANMMQYAQELRRQRMVDPRNDIITVLTGAAEGSEGLSDEELGSSSSSWWWRGTRPPGLPPPTGCEH